MNSRVMLGLTLLVVTSQAGAEFPGSLLADPGSLLRRAQPDAFAGLAVIEPLAMDDMRGGFSFSGGVNISFGATATTMIDGIRLQTVFQVNEAGSHIVSQQIMTGVQQAPEVASAAGMPSVSLAIQDFLSRYSVPVSISAGAGEAPSQADGSAAVASAGGGASAAAQGSGSNSRPNPVLAATPVSGLGARPAPAPTSVAAASTNNNNETGGVAPATVATPAIATTPAVATPAVVDVPAANVTAAVSSPAAAGFSQPAAHGTQAAAPVEVGPAAAPSQTVVLVGPQSGTSVTQVAPADVDLSGVADVSGVVIKDAQGFTAALHQLTQEAVRSAVISNKSGQQIRNELNIDIKVQNLREAAADNLRSSIMDSVQRRIGQ